MDINANLGIKTIPTRLLSGSAKAAQLPDSESPVPSDAVTLGGSAEVAAPAKKSFLKKAANIVSMLSIGSAIALGIAGMVVAPAILVGVTIVAGFIATDKDTPSKVTVWLDKREADLQAREARHHRDPASGNAPTTLTMA